MIQCFLLRFPPVSPLQGLRGDLWLWLFFSFGSEDGSLESPGFDQGNLWSLRFHMEEGGTFKVLFPYGKLTRFGVGISIMAHQGPTHPSFPLGNLDSLNQSSLKGHSPAFSFRA